MTGRAPARKLAKLIPRMLIENDFAVARPIDDVWAFMLDVEKVAPCMPGAELTEVVDDHTWKGLVKVKFGPVTMSFAGTVSMSERDDEARRVVLTAKGTEQKGKGAATATVAAWMEAKDPSTTTVRQQTDLMLTGAAAQLSRGLLPAVSQQLIGQFAECLEATMALETTAAAAAAPPPATAKPVGGFTVGLKAIWASIVGLFRRLFGRSEA